MINLITIKSGASQNEAATKRSGPPLGQTESGLPRLAYSMHETAEILGVSYLTVWRLLQRGLLKSSKALRHKLIPLTEIQKFLKETAV